MREFKNVIQVAGVIDKEEADLIISLGVKYLGFPLRLTVNKEDLTDEEAKEIIASFPPDVHGVLITYLNTAEEIVALAEKIGADTIQIHGEIELEEMAKLRRKRADFFLIKSLIVGKANSNRLFKELEAFSPYVDAFITDTYDPSTGAEGATGKTHDWEISKQIVRKSSRPVILAGGLNPANVREAVKSVRPAGVDVHTGVENKTGRKDYELLKKFVDEAAAGFAEVGT